MEGRPKYEAALRGWLWLPYQVVADLDHLKQEVLTHQPRRLMDGTKPAPVPLYFDVPEKRVIGVPQAFGVDAFGQWIEVADRTTEGLPIKAEFTLPDPNHKSVQDPVRQKRFMDDTEQAARTHGRFLAVAPTGSGKTVVGCRTAAALGRRTIIMVHRSKILDQWEDTLVNLMGVPRDRIGRVTGKRKDLTDKDFILSTYQTIGLKPHQFPMEFYEQFGTVIYDEVHLCGAAKFSQAVWQFPARVRIGFTATPERKDKADKIFLWHIGPIKVRSTQTALPIQVWPVWYNCGSRGLWGKNHGTRMKCLALDPVRNQRIAGLVKRMYDSGRNAIVVGESIDHLQGLMRLSKEAGVPKDDMGLFTGSHYYLTTETQVSGNVVRKQEVRKQKTHSRADLDKVIRDARIIFATYGMIKEGVDIPRLDCGIDATPQSSATQLIGRVRRPHEGKKSPILWVTFVDVNCDRSLRYYAARCDEYRKSGAEVIDVKT